MTDLLVYTGAALAGGLVVFLLSAALRRRRARQLVSILDSALAAAVSARAGSARAGGCSAAEAAQPFVAGCASGCGWHQHEATEELAEAAARSHAGRAGHGVAWGPAEEFKA